MSKKTGKTVFTCQSCGYQTSKWMGRCPECDQWESFVEEVLRAPNPRGTVHGANAPVPIDATTPAHEERTHTGIGEFDRVLGGGIVLGSLVLIGGDPGIGKSTLMLQALSGMARQGRKVLYVSGEESVRQLMIRSRRLDSAGTRPRAGSVPS